MAHLQTIKYYIQKRRHTVAKTIPDCEILKECMGAKRRQGTPPCLFSCGQEMEEAERGEYLWVGKERTAVPPTAAAARLAPQARTVVDLGVFCSFVR